MIDEKYKVLIDPTPIFQNLSLKVWTDFLLYSFWLRPSSKCVKTGVNIQFGKTEFNITEFYHWEQLVLIQKLYYVFIICLTLSYAC